MINKLNTFKNYIQNRRVIKLDAFSLPICEFYKKDRGGGGVTDQKNNRIYMSHSFRHILWHQSIKIFFSILIVNLFNESWGVDWSDDVVKRDFVDFSKEIIFLIIFFFYFFKDCVDGFYNSTCTAKCGHCKDNLPCNKQNGYCPRNCTGNFKPPLCQGIVNTSFLKVYISFVNLTKNC